MSIRVDPNQLDLISPAGQPGFVAPSAAGSGFVAFQVTLATSPTARESLGHAFGFQWTALTRHV